MTLFLALLQRFEDKGEDNEASKDNCKMFLHHPKVVIDDESNSNAEKKWWFDAAVTVLVIASSICIILDGLLLDTDSFKIELCSSLIE